MTTPRPWLVLYLPVLLALLSVALLKRVFRFLCPPEWGKYRHHGKVHSYDNYHP